MHNDFPPKKMRHDVKVDVMPSKTSPDPIPAGMTSSTFKDLNAKPAAKWAVEAEIAAAGRAIHGEVKAGASSSVTSSGRARIPLEGGPDSQRDG